MTTAVRLADDLFALLSEEDPLNASQLGVAGHDDRLRDLSPEAESSLRDRAAAIAGRAEQLEGAALSVEDRLTTAVVRHEAAALLARIGCHGVEYTITDMFFAPAAELLTFLPTASVSDSDKKRDYLARLAKIPTLLGQAADRNRQGGAAGRTAVARLVRAAIRQVEDYLADPASDPFRRPTPPAPDPRFQEVRDGLLADVVRPAFATYRHRLADEVLPHSRQDDMPGLCWLSSGEEWYTALARSHTTTPHSAAELHELGLERIKELQESFAEIASRLFGTSSYADALTTLREDLSLRCRDGEEILRLTREAITRAGDAAPDWFTTLPEARCSVEAAPESGPAAYYLPPSLDGERAGTCYVNTGNASKRELYGIEAVAYHEGVPGHHLQLSLAQKLSHLPMLRRTSVLTAYAEGWGVYAERLADEMGLYSGDLARLGMLAVDARRTARLVVDTGLHAFGWSRDQAVSFMCENTARPLVEINGDVDRFIALPGQALAYTIGQMAILDIREKAKHTLGSRFDIRAFHDIVLRNGALPLSTLAELVSTWARGAREPQPH
ncbi:DUF885 domain-containing protein [Actinocrinis puniceicyclus]|uniref:DUF885 domain-containing protein n=1 Tax=Actinocrinis puniceicyclus TaxID=977794 RepID=A0A8J7WMY5_9ACTN|nr:DUF885 domain-containing protein [Actinocrinis puniceicyclus]MBS2962400.1 DUF885 domain-containing protein [Actinocrinis puniceicyclus]